jgi:hypothetical protein
MSTNAGIRNLGEAIILQSIEDLWDERYRSDSLTFFKEKGFNICANMAGIKLFGRLTLLRLLRKSAENPEKCMPKGEKSEYFIG